MIQNAILLDPVAKSLSVYDAFGKVGFICFRNLRAQSLKRYEKALLLLTDLANGERMGVFRPKTVDHLRLKAAQDPAHLRFQRRIVDLRRVYVLPKTKSSDLAVADRKLPLKEVLILGH